MVRENVEQKILSAVVELWETMASESPDQQLTAILPDAEFGTVPMRVIDAVTRLPYVDTVSRQVERALATSAGGWKIVFKRYADVAPGDHPQHTDQQRASFDRVRKTRQSAGVA